MEKGQHSYLVATSHPRVIDGKPSKNPRYLQPRHDLDNPRDSYVADVSMRFQRRVPMGQPVYKPVNVVVPGRRNNPPEGKIRSLAVYNPIHYVELPELFMGVHLLAYGQVSVHHGRGQRGRDDQGAVQLPAAHHGSE